MPDDPVLKATPLDILEEAVAPNAFHDSGARYDSPKCHPNTRVAVLEKIMNWIRGQDNESRDRIILWLTGAAGAGKSSIAQSIIEQCVEEGLVLASFFFGRTDQTRNHGGSFVATLAYQIYSSVPATQIPILEAIQKDRLIFTRNLECQFNALVILPLYSVFSSGKPYGPGRVIVIDGLDECIDRGVQQKILKMICNAIQKFNLPILFFIASRPEHDITVTFRSTSMDGFYTRLYLDDRYKPDRDIRVFLQDSFENIRKNHPFKTRIPDMWPTPHVLELLVRKSSGQFIYAATVVRFVQSLRHQPHHRLEIVTNLRPAQGSDLPFAQLDALYSMIFSGVAEIDKVLYALSMYFMRPDMMRYDFTPYERLLSLEEGELEILFCDLGALVQIEQVCEMKRIRILHASLEDFLLDPTRSQEYFIDLNLQRNKHVENSLRYLPQVPQRYIICLAVIFGENVEKCDITPDIVRHIAYLPLRDMIQDSLERGKYAKMLRYLVGPLLQLLKRMTQTSIEWKSLEQLHHNALDCIYTSYIIAYLHGCSDSLRVELSMLYHSGSSPLIPIISFIEPRNTTNDLPIFSSFPSKFLEKTTLERDDILHISSHWKKGDHIDAYREDIIQFLRDSNRSGKCTIGKRTSAITAAHCIITLESLSWAEEETTCEEEVMLNFLSVDDGIWVWSVSKDHLNKGDDYFYVDAPQLFFLVLGYLIYFLPLSSRNEELLRLCRQETFSNGQGKECFPIRTRLASEAINAYLKRMDRY